MFSDCSVFDSALTFNTGLVTNMQYMFRNCTNFDQPLNFNTSAVNLMNGMFQGATAFDQNIGAWNITSVTNFSNFMLGKTPATWSQTNFDNLLCGWSPQTVNPNLIINFGTANFTNATGLACKNVLTGAPNNWIVNSGGGV
jgi:hypothetical protein